MTTEVAGIEEQFVEQIRKSVVDDLLASYVLFIREKELEQIKSEAWRSFLKAIRTEGAEAAVAVVFRQVLVDALATVLAITDGSSNLDTLRGEFQLVYEGKLLDKTLAEIFWEREQAPE